MPVAPTSARARKSGQIPTAALARLVDDLRATGQAAVIEPPMTAGQRAGSDPSVSGTMVSGTMVSGTMVSGTMVSGISFDSRAVPPGSLFVCLSGSRYDGHDYASEAIAAGARALVVSQPLSVPVPQVVVADTRLAMPPMAAAFYGHPSRKLAVAGVTGTNGKTTVTHLLASILRAAGRAVEVIGTLSQARTTPESPVLQAHLAAVVDGGGDAVAMEVSSHALAQHRVDATSFAVAVFTNLTPDHLDYHGTMEDYFAAKAELFRPDRVPVAVIDTDSEYGRRLADIAEGRGIRVRKLARSLVGEVSLVGDRTHFGWGDWSVRLPMVGGHNLANAVVAAAAAEEMGVATDQIARGLTEFAGVPGRFERIRVGQPFTVVVDYAHTPVALEETLLAARQLADSGAGRVAVAFGCGGDRDRAKRPLMGEVAARNSDLAVVTSDNPRSEDPGAIIDDIKAGSKELVVEVDRQAAIARVLDWARAGDVVVVAGKGHEITQEAGGRVVAFDDRAVVAGELERLSRGC